MFIMLIQNKNQWVLLINSADHSLGVDEPCSIQRPVNTPHLWRDVSGNRQFQTYLCFRPSILEMESKFVFHRLAMLV